ncbi:hypothetical protein CC86DRAFT_414113 [Ophiobolus disseminans]|uniref:Uncharacterized protein n=1 Tax=Ophiobolus disseminans TaxID=1469910 RepID=A0A6A6ZB41_9PLEO|nr:hypothetical protein CC86DRAFT_414113 [Ophiobolus disseminans]
MAQASASTCKAAGNDTTSVVTTEYSNSRTSKQWSRESQHHAPAEDDKNLDCCFGSFPWLMWFFATTTPKKRPDRLSWGCAGPTEPGVVNSPTNKLDQESDTQGLSLTSSSLQEKTAQYWDFYAERALQRALQSEQEDTPSLIQKPALHTLKTPQTTTINVSNVSVPPRRFPDDSQLATSEDPLFPNLDNGVVESKCELGQTFNSKDDCILVTTSTKVFVGTA